jgi:Icc-related predicted phosphoesterase
VNILSISDKKVPIIYSPQVKCRFEHIDFVIACGDLPYYYLEFIISSLDKPLFFVRGNHDPEIEYGERHSYTHPRGGIDLHQRVICYENILIGGMEGSIRYKSNGLYQYTQSQMWLKICRLLPKLLFNRLVYGRYLDIFITHSPPWKIHDQDDLPHQGIKAFRWFIETIKPKCHFHGHTHVYRPDTVTETVLNTTRVINTYGYKETKYLVDP